MFIPCKETILEMTPTEFEKYSLYILSEQVGSIANCTIQHNKIIEVDDGNYQIDGYIEFEIMGVNYKTLLECKHYKSSISREKVAVLYDKLRACGANKGVIVSSSNFQRGAIQYASKHNIALIQLTDSGSRYETRTGFEYKNNYPLLCNKKSIDGIVLSGTEQMIHCNYLSNNNLELLDFLLNINHS